MMSFNLSNYSSALLLIFVNTALSIHRRIQALTLYLSLS